MMSSDDAKIKELSWGMSPFKAIREGVKKFGAMDVWKQIRQCKEMKMGTLVGEDEHGNRYFENKDEQFGRDRWVVYNTGTQHMDYDPATVPAKWHGWLHHMYDDLPTEQPKYAYVAPYDPVKKTGRDTQYRNPGHFLGGKARGDGYLQKSGTARPSFESGVGGVVSKP